MDQRACVCIGTSVFRQGKGKWHYEAGRKKEIKEGMNE